jgi:hypothetical protein
MEDLLIGPYVLPRRLTGVACCNYYFGKVVPELMKEVPLQVQNHMWFMHDEASAHFLIHV